MHTPSYTTGHITPIEWHPMRMTQRRLQRWSSSHTNEDTMPSNEVLTLYQITFRSLYTNTRAQKVHQLIFLAPSSALVLFSERITA
jgi:hypothetical protein